MTRIKYLFPFSIFAVVMVAGCKTASVFPGKAMKPLPATYPDIAGTANSAAINWTDYFTDPVLISLIDTALDNNLDLLMALQRIEAAKADVRFSKGLLLPVVDGVAWGGQEKTGIYSINWAGNEGENYSSGDPLRPTFTDYYIGFQSAWELDIWKKLRNKRKAALLRYLASVEGTTWVTTNLVEEISNNYYELLGLDNELEIIRETIKLQGDALVVVRIKKEVGAANALAVQQFKAQLLNLQSLEKETLQQITETENRLNFLLGRFPQPIERDPDFFNNDSISIQVQAGVPSDLLQNRPDIRSSEYELAATKADVESARAAFYPSLSITAGVGYNAFKPGYLFFSPQSIAYNLFGNLTAPLFNLNAIKAEFDRANATQLEALYNYQRSILQAVVEVSNELSHLRNLEEIYSLKTEEVSILSQSIETSADLFRTGRATYLEELLAQQNALQAKLDLVNIKRRQYYAIVNIYKVLGGGWK